MTVFQSFSSVRGNHLVGDLPLPKWDFTEGNKGEGGVTWPS